MKSVQTGARTYVPVEALAVPIAADGQILASFRKIALSCLAHLEVNLEGMLNSDDPEFIHQMRVSARRLRVLSPALNRNPPAVFSHDTPP